MKPCDAAVWLAVAGSCGAPAAWAQAPDAAVLVRSSMLPAHSAVIGQRVELFVDVLFRGTMAMPPRVTLAQAPGAQVFRFETQGRTLRETQGTTAYVGQRFEFAVYPRRAGTIVIPAASVQLLNRAGDIVSSLRGEDVDISVSVPPGVDAGQPVLASPAVTMQESWSAPDDAPITVGGALVRTVRRRAQDAPSLGFAPLPAAAPQGVRVYEDPPDANDEITRDDITGRRTDRITYAFERAGTFTLPAMAQSWWDLGSNSLRRAVIPPRTIDVTAAAPPRSVTGPWRRVWLTIAGLLALLAALAALRTLRHGAPREPALFRALMRRARRGDAAGTYAALCAWREAAAARGPAASNSVQELASVTRLERHLFGGGAWDVSDGKTMARELRRFRGGGARTRWRRRAALPALNPGEEGSVLF